MQSIDTTKPDHPCERSSAFSLDRNTLTGRMTGGISYALIKSARGVRSEEVESDEVAVEVMVMWGSQVLQVVHLSPPRPFSVGEGSPGEVQPDYCIPSDTLRTQLLPLVVGHRQEATLVIPGHAEGSLELADGQRLALADARRRAQPSAQVSGAHEWPLAMGTRVRFELGDFVFQLAVVNAGKRVQKGLFAGADWNAVSYFGASFMAVGGFLAAMAFLVPDLNALSDETLDRERLYLINAMLEARAERERDQRDGPAPSDTASDEGGTGERSAGDEGAMGQQTSQEHDKRYAVQGRPDNPDPHLARTRALEEARSFGMLSILSGDPNAPTAPWGRESALGLDSMSAQGTMWGDELGEAYGSGGLGLSGLGEGAGGRGEGIGLGDIGFGTGAGLGLGHGFGRDGGHLGGGHPSKAPRMRSAGDTTVSGRLPPEVIQRIVRQNFGRFRMCYERGLGHNPNLEGRVAVRFVIGRDGSVSNAQNGGSDLPDSSVVACVVSAFYGVSFPQPDNGIVTVSYPIMFSPG